MTTVASLPRCLDSLSTQSLDQFSNPVSSSRDMSRDSLLYNREGNWAELTFTKTCGTATRDMKTIGQKLSGASTVTIPETIAGRISAPVPLLFLKWRMLVFVRRLCRFTEHDNLKRHLSIFFFNPTQANGHVVCAGSLPF